jgi:peroxiredoxin
MKKTCLILVVFAFLVSCASTAQSPEPSLKAGANAPDFSLVDVSGNPVKLSEFKEKKNIVLIFYTDFREGGNTNWPTCSVQLGELQERLSEIEKLNAEVIAISSKGDQQDVEKIRRHLGLTFTLIPKPNRKVAEDFGVWNRYRNRAVATIVIDKKGRIRFIEVSNSDDRTSASKIIRELQGI